VAVEVRRRAVEASEDSHTGLRVYVETRSGFAAGLEAEESKVDRAVRTIRQFGWVQLNPGDILLAGEVPFYSNVYRDQGAARFYEKVRRDPHMLGGAALVKHEGDHVSVVLGRGARLEFEGGSISPAEEPVEVRVWGREGGFSIRTGAGTVYPIGIGDTVFPRARPAGGAVGAPGEVSVRVVEIVGGSTRERGSGVLRPGETSTAEGIVLSAERSGSLVVENREKDMWVVLDPGTAVEVPAGSRVTLDLASRATIAVSRGTRVVLERQTRGE